METLRIIPSITSHQKQGSTWREKIGEVIELKIPQLGLFVTGLSNSERKECIRMLCYIREQHYFTIPFVHAVSDMDDSEYRLLREVFKTEWFNLHPLREFPLKQKLSAETRSRILIENSCFVEPLRSSDLEGFAGLCIDLSHLEDARLAMPDCYQQNLEMCSKYPVLANHISGIKAFANRVHKHQPAHSDHMISELTELHYLNQLPSSAVSPLAALELENSLQQQLSFIETVRAALSAKSKNQFALAA
jgi:hypothetical protein